MYEVKAWVAMQILLCFPRNWPPSVLANLPPTPKVAPNCFGQYDRGQLPVEDRYETVTVTVVYAAALQFRVIAELS